MKRQLITLLILALSYTSAYAQTLTPPQSGWIPYSMGPDHWRLDYKSKEYNLEIGWSKTDNEFFLGVDKDGIRLFRLYRIRGNSKFLHAYMWAKWFVPKSGEAGNSPRWIGAEEPTDTSGKPLDYLGYFLDQVESLPSVVVRSKVELWFATELAARRKPVTPSFPQPSDYTVEAQWTPVIVHSGCHDAEFKGIVKGVRTENVVVKVRYCNANPKTVSANISVTFSTEKGKWTEDILGVYNEVDSKWVAYDAMAPIFISIEGLEGKSSFRPAMLALEHDDFWNTAPDPMPKARALLRR